MKLKCNDIKRLVTGIVGAILIFFVGWHWHVAIAIWLSVILLIRSFRITERWYKTIPVLIATILFRFLSITGGWDIPFYLNLVFSILVLMPLWAALYIDRWYARSGKKLGALLMFPLVYSAGDFLLGFSPLGDVFSPAIGQFGFEALIQTVSLTGIWGITFIIGLTATVVNHVWENGFDLRKTSRSVITLVAVFAFLLAYGYGKILLTQPSNGTVRIAGITEPHHSDYWSITDNGTPPESKAKYASELTALQNRLFALSQRAAEYGAKIIFWSEANAVMYQDDLKAFLKRASTFAREHKVYLAPTLLVLRYNQEKNDNLIYLFGPDGKELFRYEKTHSWYPTDSNGIIPSAKTPWGILSAVICFDLDFPIFLRQAFKREVDILLVPGFDTKLISPYHTEIGRLRGIEYGFSIFRQANKSTSIATDYNGNVLAYQDYFNTKDRIMIADVPIKGIRTIYGTLGDWFIILVWIALVAMLGITILKTIKKR